MSQNAEEEPLKKLTLLVLMVGCASYVKHWTPIMQASVGQNVQEYITMWAPPMQVYEDTPGPNKAYVWSFDVTTTSGRVNQARRG
jgi:hypothetical protein